MGGKRPDQYQIDPADSGATDYKNLPQTGRGTSNLDDTVELDRQQRARTEDDDRNPPHRHRHPPPSRDANRPLQEAKERREEKDPIHSEPGAAETEPDKGNPLV